MEKQITFEENTHVKVKGQIEFPVRVLYSFQFDNSTITSEKGIPIDKILGNHLARFDGQITVFRDEDIRFLEANLYTVIYPAYERENSFEWTYEGVSSFTEETKEFIRSGMKHVYKLLRNKID